MEDAYTWQNHWSLVGLNGMKVKPGMAIANEYLLVLETIGSKPPERITGDEDDGAINFEWPVEGVRLWAHEDGRVILTKPGDVVETFAS